PPASARSAPRCLRRAAAPYTAHKNPPPSAASEPASSPSPRWFQAPARAPENRPAARAPVRHTQSATSSAPVPSHTTEHSTSDSRAASAPAAPCPQFVSTYAAWHKCPSTPPTATPANNSDHPTAQSSSSLFSFPRPGFGSRLRHLHRIQNLIQLRIAQHFLLPRQLYN